MPHTPESSEVTSGGTIYWPRCLHPRRGESGAHRAVGCELSAKRRDGFHRGAPGRSPGHAPSILAVVGELIGRVAQSPAPVVSEGPSPAVGDPIGRDGTGCVTDGSDRSLFNPALNRGSQERDGEVWRAWQKAIETLGSVMEEDLENHLGLVGISLTPPLLSRGLLRNSWN